MLQQHRKGVTFLPKFESGMENMADMFVFETGDLLEKLDEILMRTEQEDLSPPTISTRYSVPCTLLKALPP